MFPSSSESGCHILNHEAKPPKKISYNCLFKDWELLVCRPSPRPPSRSSQPTSPVRMSGTENYSIKPGFRSNKSRHYAYIIYSVKTRFFKRDMLPGNGKQLNNFVKNLDATVNQPPLNGGCAYSPLID